MMTFFQIIPYYLSFLQTMCKTNNIYLNDGFLRIIKSFNGLLMQ